MDLRGITLPRHAGLPPMLPVNTGQPRYQFTVGSLQLSVNFRYFKNTVNRYL